MTGQPPPDPVDRGCRPPNPSPEPFGDEGPRDEALRFRNIRERIQDATLTALGLSGLLILVALLVGEISLAPSRVGEALRLTIRLGSPLFSVQVGMILAWDVSFCLLALLLIRCRPSPDREFEAVLALGGCLFLWRIVLRLVSQVIFPDGVSWVTAPSLPAFWVHVGILGFLKLRIAAALEACDQRLDSPLLAFFTWHHRKDAIFNILFAIALTAGAFGVPYPRADLLLTFVKIALLGSAAAAITVRSLTVLLRPRAIAEAGRV